MPQLRRPDYQPPQTLAYHVAPRESPEGARHVTATSLMLSVETGGRSALPKPPSYRQRTVKGHCGCIRGMRRCGVLLGLGWRYVIATNHLGNTDSCRYKTVPEKRHNIVPLVVTKGTMLDPFL